MYTSSSTVLTRIGRPLVAPKNTALLRTVALQTTPTPTLAGRGGGGGALRIQTHLMWHFEHTANVLELFPNLLYGFLNIFSRNARFSISDLSTLPIRWGKCLWYLFAGQAAKYTSYIYVRML